MDNGNFNKNENFNNGNFNNANYNNGNFNNGYNMPPQQPMYPQNPNNNKAVASMVLGICAIVVGGCLIPIIGIILGIIAIVMGVAANKMGKTGMATAGVITGAVGIGLAVINWILAILIIAEYGIF